MSALLRDVRDAIAVRALGPPDQHDLPCWTCIMQGDDDIDGRDAWECPECGTPLCGTHALAGECASCEHERQYLARAEEGCSVENP